MCIHVHIWPLHSPSPFLSLLPQRRLGREDLLLSHMSNYSWNHFTLNRVRFSSQGNGLATEAFFSNEMVGNSRKKMLLD